MKLLLTGFCFILVTACASTKTGDLLGGSSSSTRPAEVKRDDSKEDSLVISSESNGSATHNELVYRGMKIENVNFDLPVEMNHAVEKWIDYFTGRGRERFAKYLERSEYFIPYIKPILKNAKAPEDLVYLAMIESGFNNNARSNARAVGAWKFISATGRRYGLDINWWIDERRDVEKSTIAAVQYLKELNALYGSWHLAAASYNAGEAKIARAMKKYHTDNFWELCKGKFLRPETKNYVPKLFAAAIIGKNRKQFGFEENYTQVKSVNAETVLAKAEDNEDLERLPDQLEPEKAESLAADKDSPKNLGKEVGAKVEKIEKGVTASEPTVELTKDSPPAPEEAAALAQDSMEKMLRTMSNVIRTPHVNRKGEVNGDVLTEVEIPSPADLFKVSSCAGLSYLEFKSMNPELLRWLTPAESKSYKIRIPLSHKDAFMKKYFNPSFKRDVTFLVYKARKGDTAKSIAKRFGISSDPLVDMNGVKSDRVSFMPGTLVELPIPNDFVRSLASLKSLDLLDPIEKRRGHHRHRRSRSRSVNSSAARSDIGKNRL